MQLFDTSLPRLHSKQCLHKHNAGPAGAIMLTMNGCCFNTPDGRPLGQHTRREPLTYVPVKDKVLTSREFKAMLRKRRQQGNRDYYQ